MSKEHCAVRLTPEDIQKVDAIAKAKRTKWDEPSRSSILRGFTLDGIEAWEKEHGPLPVTVVHSENPVRDMPRSGTDRRKRAKAQKEGGQS
jgi:hypothetical protein